MFADQALASLRIETYLQGNELMEFQDQALASLRIETESHEVILWDTNRSGSREPAD